MKPISIIEKTNFVNIVVRVAIEKEGKYLLVQEGKEYVRGLWSFPGGKLDVGETLSAAATREIQEETGIEVDLQGVIGLQHRLWEDRDGFTLEINFLAHVRSMPSELPTSEEVVALEWKSLSEIKAMAEAKLLRNPGQLVIAQLIEKGELLPLSTLIEGYSPAPKAL